MKLFVIIIAVLAVSCEDKPTDEFYHECMKEVGPNESIWWRVACREISDRRVSYE